MSDFRTFLQERISQNLPVFFDGGMGTMIQASGVTDYVIPEDLSITHPDVIKAIHRKYLDAGCHVLTANTFGANPLKLSNAPYSCSEYIKAEMKILRESVAEAERDGNKRPHFISWDTGQIGRLLEPMGDLTFDEAYQSYRQAAMLAESEGAQVAIIETMSDLYEMKAAILAVQENTKMAVIATPTFQSNLRTLTGADVLTCVTYLEALHVDLLGLNCGGSLEEDNELARQFLQYAHTPVLVQPNAGIPVVVNGKTMYRVSAADFAASQKINRLAGAAALGGCCGTTPPHIAAMIRELEGEPLPQTETQGQCSANTKTDTFICSYNQTVQIGGKAGPQIVGERINPTGKKKCKEALLAGDMNFVLNEAESQINAGAQILDVNVGLPGIDEAATMVTAVKTIQSTFSTPLQIDSSESAVLEKALRYYNGKPLVNSINGRKDVMDKVLPIVAHYGGALVALCIDENGIAPTAEGRCEVARKIIREAATYGIQPRDIVIDTLTLTVSSQQKEALETVRAISLLKQEFGAQGLRFILGVSNISFGLPRRDIINSRFFAMALYAGLDACIINPLSEPMMESYYGYRALAGYDENCLSYIETYTGTSAPLYGLTAEQAAAAKAGREVPGKGATKTDAPGIGAPPKALPQGNGANSVSADSPTRGGVPKLPENLTDGERNLIEIICKGFKEKSGAATTSLLNAGAEAVAIIDRCIVPALDLVGKDFEIGLKFLPQLLLSADTVGASFAVIKAHLEASGSKQESKGTIAIATVFGDIHDIGKNITKAMLENYGYTVIDLGKNVPSEKVVETVIKNDIKLLGLSALMTTTVGNMQSTIQDLHAALEKNGKSCKIMAGGAVLTADYAVKIGADYYVKDAMASVAVAKEIFG